MRDLQHTKLSMAADAALVRTHQQHYLSRFHAFAVSVAHLWWRWPQYGMAST